VVSTPWTPGRTRFVQQRHDASSGGRRSPTSLLPSEASDMKNLLLLPALLLCNSLASIPVAADTFTVINTNDSGDGSLRWAIAQAEAAPGWDRVVFDIPGAGVHTIQLLGPLFITSPMSVDGTTQPGYASFPSLAGTPLIELDGSLAGGSAGGIWINSSGGSSSLRGLAIGNFSAEAIGLISAPACTLAASHIGCNAAGTQPLLHTASMRPALTVS
jgi:hypothetical protein